ncbi:MAG: porin family protein [Bacteroidota bacterium]
MKKFILILFFSVTCTYVLQAQRVVVPNLPKYDYKKIHFGFSLGVNKYDFFIRPIQDYKLLDSLYVLESKPEMGFDIGLVSNLRLAEYLDLRFTPTLSFGDRVLEYTYVKNDTNVVTLTKRVESSIVELPFSIKYKSARVNNFRAYLIGGGKFNIDMASQAKKKSQTNDLIKLKQNDVCAEIGVGIDIYFEYFKFSPQLKLAVGVRDLLVRENSLFTNSIDRLGSKVVMFTFYFE